MGGEGKKRKLDQNDWRRRRRWRGGLQLWAGEGPKEVYMSQMFYSCQKKQVDVSASGSF